MAKNLRKVRVVAMGRAAWSAKKCGDEVLLRGGR